MDQDTLFNIGLVLLFILVGGVFAGTEIALVSLRESQINRLENRGSRGARVASVARDPNRFLAAVQIGVTVAGFFSAAYGASTLAPDFVPVLEGAGLSTGLAQAISLIGLTLVIAYLSLVLGELVPKRFALQRSQGVALLVGPALDRFATLMRPVVWMLSISTNAVVRLLGGDPTAKSEAMTEEELRDIVVAHEGLSEDERRIVGDVFDAADRSLSEVMRPRGEVTFMDGDTPVSQALETVRSRPYSRYPVIGEDFDDVIGLLHVRDLLDAAPTTPVRDLTRAVLHLPSTAHLLPTLSQMRREGRHLAVVLDEYGGTDGIVTLEDLVEELIGDIRDEYDAVEPTLAPSTDGTMTVDAGLTIEHFADRTGVELEDGPYETAAGYVISRLGRVARVGDTVTVADHELVVTETDGNRLLRLQVIPPEQMNPDTDAEATNQDTNNGQPPEA
ncbi:hemolysin family protein [Cellulomonas fimi]|uniref:HlyC/CorC family transporter n=1 Tax=Cellulomonas fimi TaxID=1708 RepID=A0A7Y0LZR4_CELFI|nr:hemolysin family protein [Cellulomonas fimi]NMR21222.1 HlyC/CorC family transporter [Cellulomonas fimi]